MLEQPEFQSIHNTRLLKAEDIAEILQISRSMTYLLLQRGDIPVVRVGRAVRIRPHDLNAFIERSIHSNNS